MWSGVAVVEFCVASGEGGCVGGEGWRVREGRRPGLKRRYWQWLRGEHAVNEWRWLEACVWRGGGGLRRSVKARLGTWPKGGLERRGHRFKAAEGNGVGVGSVEALARSTGCRRHCEAGSSGTSGRNPLVATFADMCWV